jgi:hypothetical protein
MDRPTDRTRLDANSAMTMTTQTMRVCLPRNRNLVFLLSQSVILHPTHRPPFSHGTCCTWRHTPGEA